MPTPEHLAFHNDAAFKTRLLEEIIRHRRVDALVKGTYGRGQGTDWKGCAVGCALHSLNLMAGMDAPTSDSSRYRSELGIPESIARLEERIFEGLEAAKAKLWPERFTSAIPVGADLSLVPSQFMVWLIDDHRKYVGDPPAARSAIDTVRALHIRIVSGGTVSNSEWSRACNAAIDVGAPLAACAAIALRNASGAANAVRHVVAARTSSAILALWKRLLEAWSEEGMERVVRAESALRSSVCEEMADKLVALLRAA